MEIPLETLYRQVGEFRAKRKVFVAIQSVLEATLKELARSVDPTATVSARPKNIASFAGKLVRKRKYLHPLTEVTDLCGARIVCSFESQVRSVCELIRTRFGKAIEESDSLDHRSRLRTGEFGYRSVHYVVQLREEEKWTGLTKEMHGRKIEIQVRTRLQDIWSNIGHDRVYKSPHGLPESIMREVARIAAQFEGLDEEFERVVGLVDDYRSHFGAYLNEAELADEASLQKVLRRHDADNPDVPLRQAELAMSLDRWQDAIDAIQSFGKRSGRLTPRLAATLGFALCQKAPENRDRKGFKDGLKLLERATKEAPQMIMGWIRRAECTGGADEALTRICYYNAYRIDPADPAALAGYVRWQLEKTTNTGFVEILRPAIMEAIGRCERQAAVKVDLPWSFFRAAFFRLLLIVCLKPARLAGQSPVRVFAEDDNTEKELLNAALKEYANAIAFSRNATPIKVAHQTALRLREAVVDSRHAHHVDIVVLFLQLAKEKLEAAATGDSLADRLKPLVSSKPPKLEKGPRVMIVAGTSRPTLIDKKIGFDRIIGHALNEFRGTVFSGGTKQGVPGIVGRIGAKARNRLQTVGYIPRSMGPASGRNKAYTTLLETSGSYFSQMEPLQAWIDLIAGGVNPADVTLLGLGGGRISAFEYRLALLMGARVGVIAGTGREADELAADAVWRDPSKWRLWRIPLKCADEPTLRAFIHPGRALPNLDYTKIGRAVHEGYIADNLDKLINPKLSDWNDLLPHHKDSSIAQAVEAAAILGACGFELRIASKKSAVANMEFTKNERERLARLEHGRWTAERFGQGWAFGKEKDQSQKTHPDLVSWELLSPGARAKDFRAVARWPKLFAKEGFDVVRKKRSGRHKSSGGGS